MIQQFFDVSTIHVPNSTSINEIPDIIIAEYDTGYFIYVPPYQFKEYPDWLIEIFELAVSNGCHYIRIDADGEQYDELRKFDW